MSKSRGTISSYFEISENVPEEDICLKLVKSKGFHVVKNELAEYIRTRIVKKRQPASR